ncbi:MAG: electron transfer flavoprotein subunit alpha/FixB family protein [Desulfobacteraceae bacterium]
MTDIIVIAEIFENRVRPVTWELIAAAVNIQEVKNRDSRADATGTGKIKVIVPAEEPLPPARVVAEKTGLEVTGLKIPGLTAYNSDMYKAYLSSALGTMNFSHVLAAHTAQGRDFAPGLAVRLNAVCVSGVVDIKKEENRLVYFRLVSNSTKLLGLGTAEERPVLLTIMPDVFHLPESFNQENKRILNKRIKVREMVLEDIHFTPRIKNVNVFRIKGEKSLLKGADIIVAAGRGIEKKSNLDLVFKFAAWFSSAAVGASRPLVDMGWIGYGHQVGITGQSVSPRLYIACGISGSSQHLAGMKNAGIVVAVNKHPAAPISRHCDLYIQADAPAFIKTFLNRAKHRK